MVVYILIKRNLGTKKCWDHYIFGSRNFGYRKLCDKKNGVEHFWVTKILDHESFQMKYNSFQEIINAKKKFGVKNIWVLKIFSIKNIWVKSRTNVVLPNITF